MGGETLRVQERTLDIEPASFFTLRTPLLPFDEMSSWAAGTKSALLARSRTNLELIRKAWHDDIQLLRSRLRETVDRPEIRHALFLGSPSLEESIDAWKRDPDSKKGTQTERALVRYFARMSGRATPFGLFSGCSVGRIANEASSTTDLFLEERAKYRAFCRLDFDYLFALTRAIRNDSSIAKELRYWPNSSLHKLGSAWQYLAPKTNPYMGSHRAIRVINDEYLETVILLASRGIKFLDLTTEMRVTFAKEDLSESEIIEYLDELIESEILVPDLVPLLTGSSPLNDILAQLEKIPAAKSAAEVLSSVHREIEVLNSQGISASLGHYKRITSSLEDLPAKLDPARLYQVDMNKPFRAGIINSAVVHEVTNGVEALFRLCKSREPDELAAFRDVFTDRYDKQWMPLLEVLDPEIGIGFGDAGGGLGSLSPIIRDLGVRRRLPTKGRTLSDIDLFLLRNVTNALRSSHFELQLAAADLPPTQSDSLPRSFSVNAIVEASSIDAINAGDFRVFVGRGSGPSGARLLGRFCSSDPELEDLVRNYLRVEESDDKDSIFAEIVYLPEGRIGNVLCRPVLRDYELIYLGRSGAPGHRQIYASDLLVTVANNEIVLYSQSLKRRIIPRMTNSHGFMNVTLPPVYRFLCYLQHQKGVGCPWFSWGPLESLQFLPRLCIGRTILAPAQWRLDGNELQRLLVSNDRYDLFTAMQEMRERWTLPRWIVLQEGDNVLPVDLDNPLSVDSLVHVLKRVPQATVQEMWPCPDNLCVRGPEGRFCHEIVVPFIATSKAEYSDATRLTGSTAVRRYSAVERVFPPGGEWLYAKIYGGTTILDDILQSVLPSLLRTALTSGLISRWFFVRYADPRYHLRIRLNGPPELIGTLTPLFRQIRELVIDGTLERLQFDTYRRELERYCEGSENFRAEDIFFADSEAVLQILEALEGDGGVDNRWKIGLLGCDRLLTDCGFTLEAKMGLVKRLRTGFEREFAAQHSNRELGERFRRERQSIEDILMSPQESSEMIRAADLAYSVRSRTIVGVVAQFQASKPSKPELDMDDLATSYMHMHINRLMRSSPREHEFVIYDFLYRSYERELKRKPRANDHHLISRSR